MLNFDTNDTPTARKLDLSLQYIYSIYVSNIICAHISNLNEDENISSIDVSSSELRNYNSGNIQTRTTKDL